MNRLRSFLKTIQRKFLNAKESPSEQSIDLSTVETKAATKAFKVTSDKLGFQLSAIEYALHMKAPLFQGKSSEAEMAARKIDFDSSATITTMNISVKGGYYPLPKGVIKARNLYVDQILTS